MKKKGKLLITRKGFEDLKAEYKFLTEKKRPEIVQRIKSARELGDISENAEYSAAKEEQELVGGRISELEEMLKRVVVVDPQKKNRRGVVTLGSRVKVHLEGEEQEFEVVGAPEADPSKNKISHESPLGGALLGKKVGDKVEVSAPVGLLTYLILEVA